MFEHAVEYNQQFAHGRDQRHLFRLARTRPATPRPGRCLGAGEHRGQTADAGRDCIDDADVLRAGGAACALGSVVKSPSTPRFREGRLWASSCAAFAGATSAN